MHFDRDIVKEEYRHLVDFFNANYGYCYLDSMHYLNQKYTPKTIVTGISYVLDAINPKLLSEFAVNFAMHSQDLYYDYLHAKLAISNNPHIENCIIGLGYYSLFYDMSLASTCGGIPLIQYHIFHKIHNMNADTNGWIDYSSENYAEYRKFAHSFFKENPSYYGPVAFLEKMAPDIEAQGGWKNLPPDIKESYAYNVAQKHNKHFEHKNTFDENVTILDKFLDLLISNNIKPYIVIMPFSEEYLKFINPEYKSIQLNVFEQMPYQIEYLDMNDLGIFDVDDFLDHAHVNTKGSQKVTYIIDQLIKGNI